LEAPQHSKHRWLPGVLILVAAYFAKRSFDFSESTRSPQFRSQPPVTNPNSTLKLFSPSLMSAPRRCRRLLLRIDVGWGEIGEEHPRILHAEGWYRRLYCCRVRPTASRPSLLLAQRHVLVFKPFHCISEFLIALFFGAK